MIALLRALVGPVALLWAFLTGRSGARTKAALDAATADLKAHERITDADLGIGASDAERVRKLNDIADRLGG